MDAFQQQLIKLAEENEKQKQIKAGACTIGPAADSTALPASAAGASSASGPGADGKKAEETAADTGKADGSTKTGATDDVGAPQKNPLGLPTHAQLAREAELEGLCKTLLGQLKKEGMPAHEEKKD